MNHRELLAEADQAAARAYAPYSKFHVGAALLAADGTVIRGCNVENSSYGLTLCAERNAIVAAVAQGHRSFRSIAIVQGVGQPGADQPCYPCGACRQVLVEFAPDLEIILRDGDGATVTTLRALLPHFFDTHRLQAT